MGKRIELIGLLGSGKSTLSMACASLGCEPLLENFEQNPFWSRSATNDKPDWFAADVVFCLQHAHQMRYAPTNALVVTDFSPVLDDFYASRRLSAEQYELLQRIAGNVNGSLVDPFAYVFLDIDPATILDRIKVRGRAEEQTITLDWIEAASERLRSHVTDNLISRGKTTWTFTAGSAVSQAKFIVQNFMQEEC